MSKYEARVALDQLVNRPAMVSPGYVGHGLGSNSEVASGLMLDDVRELANAVKADEIAADGERRAALAQAYGMTTPAQDKPFVFADGLALIPIHGVLINRFSWSWGFVTGYNFIRNQVAAAMADPDVTALVFDVNSCGGTVAGCKETADLMFEAREANPDKPMIAVIDHNCFSAAYYLTSQCTHVVITPTGSCANVGVVYTHYDITKMLEDNGVTVSLIYAGSHKVDGSPYVSMDENMRADFQKEIDVMYDTFVAAVARGRGLDEQVVRDTEARAYGATDALALGLVDAIDVPSNAIEAYFNSCDTGDTENEPGDEPDDDDEPEPEQKDTNMTVTAAKTGPAKPEATSIDADAVSASARQTERTRIAGIIGHAEAAGREKLASHLAMNTEMSVADATAILAVSPKETPPAAAAEKTAPVVEENHFEKAMNTGKQPNVGANPKKEDDTETGTGASRASSILALFAPPATGARH